MLLPADRCVCNQFVLVDGYLPRTGYSLNALVDYALDDPIGIIKGLMIGSEGTFGFVAQV